MKPAEALKRLADAVRRSLGGGRLPEIGDIKEPTLQDLFGICCGPRLFSKALKLTGEDLGACQEDRPPDTPPPRG